MRIVIGYPPFEANKGTPLLSQNRQFQWFPSSMSSYSIYPVIPAWAATLLSKSGHEIFWLDGIVKGWTYDFWLEQLEKIKPDLIAMETKTPVVKKHWKIIEDVKRRMPKVKCVLFGDHVTALPEESMKNSSGDYVLTGGDYDFLLLNLVNHLEKKEALEPGIWFRDGQQIRNTGHFRLDHDLNKLPLINRELTNWRDYAYKNSVFFRTPGTYTMFGRDCWWGKCTFCSWTTLYPGSSYRVRDVSKALEEVSILVKKYGIREIMDDSGTFPVGDWLKEFCEGMIASGLNKKVRINCNMRFNSGLDKEDYRLMGKAGFRFILYGLESSSQETLDKVNKNLKVSQIEENLLWAKKAGLSPHVTVMVGYPWETKENIENTICFVQKLFKKGLVDTMQATMVIPYPGTPLFRQCREKGWLKTQDWDRYDMREAIMKTKVSEKEIIRATGRLFSVSIWNPQFLARTLKMFTSADGVKYFSLQVFKYFAKLREFR